MSALSAALERERSSPRDGWSVSVEPFRNNFVRDSTKRGIWLLLGAVMFLLLIACANVANLLLARGTARLRELAIRTAMGATRGAVVRQLMVESVIVALVGGALGALLASAVVRAIVALMPPFTLPSETEITLSLPVLLFALCACTVSGLLAGCAPAWQAGRANVAEVMKEGGRAVAGGRHGLRRALVVLEFALALTLLVAGGMTVSALMRLVSVDLGFRGERTLTFDLPVARGHLTSAGEMEAFYRQVLERTKTLPGVASVSVSTGMPISGPNFGRTFEIASQRIADPGRRPGVGINMVTPDYHRTFGIAMVRGRGFTEGDRASSQPVAIVNQAFVKRYLPGVDPIGQRVLFAPFVIGVTTPADPLAWEIVGVHGDVANDGPGREPDPEVEIPFWQNPWPRVMVAVHTEREATTMQPAIADVLRQLDPELPMTNVRTIEQTLNLSVAADRFYTVFFATFAAVALVLAAIGIYGVMSFSVAQRTHEIGLRMALGARQRQVVGHVLREGMLTALGGTALGAFGAALAGRALAGAVYGVDASNPLTFVAVALTLLAAALLACLVPARRAASVDPMVALREE
jgi:putative ABC transport system permease protein